MHTSWRLKGLRTNLWFLCTICFLSGSLSAASMPPYSFFPALVFGLSTLFITLQQTDSKLKAFIFGWLFGFGYFLFCLSWIGNALLIDGNPYKWAWPLAVAGLPFTLSFFIALPCALYKVAGKQDRVRGFLTFIALISIFEFIRGFAFTGFPWNLFGYTWSGTLEIAQSAHWITIYGLSTMTIFWATLPGFLFETPQSSSKKNLAAIFGIISFLSVYAYGYYTINNTTHEEYSNTYVQIVQANIPQDEKWKNEFQWRNVQKHIELSQPQSPVNDQQTTIIVWPETAISYHHIRNEEVKQSIVDMLQSHQGKVFLVTGLLDRDPDTKAFANSIAVLNKKGEIIHQYKKHHLVPFGEYIPFKKYIPIPTVTSFEGFEIGEGAETIKLSEHLSFSAAICYEIIFPGEQIPPNANPNLIINVTNDAWYGISSGPHQHLAQAQFRAIEENVPVIRSANTGFSGLITPFGKILEKSKLFSTYSEKIILPKGYKTTYINTRTKLLIWLGFLIGGLILGYIQKISHLK